MYYSSVKSKSLCLLYWRKYSCFFIQSNASSKTYCYDVVYSEPSRLEHLVTGKTWQRPFCCLLAKNGTVLSSFEPHIHKQVMMSENTELNFAIKCYLDDSFSETIEFPINVSRGQDVYCKVSVMTWDPDLWLVVPSCHFTPQISRYPFHTFINNK